MRVALVHDYLKEYGGAESVLEVLSEIFPQAPIYTTVYLPEFFGPHRSRLETKWRGRIRTSFFQNFPLVAKLISPLRFFSPLTFRSFDFSGFDLIITSATGAYFPNSLNKKSAKLFCYCHTPPRYLYGLPTARNFSKNPLLRPIIDLVNCFWRRLDKKYATNVDQYIANSATTAARIKKFYNRDAVVINPPVNLPQLPNSRSTIHNLRSNFYLTGGRLARAKRYDVAIQACNQLGQPLKVFGRDFAGYLAELKSIAGKTIEFIGEIDDQTKFKLYSQAKAFIFCSDNEDFGIMPVEANACGCPVIAYRSGGVAETIIDGKTGIFFNDLTVDSLVEAIKKFEKMKFNSRDCLTQAQRFSKKIFIKNLQSLISDPPLHF
ncbi:MAG TPA: glycosyltransferase [Candidatus Woesebacteria bacterium]|nr:glycosyltransferase [Candidatus Woesebacteria bacterium]HRS22571.1 glycosyltransferase [Candidatus Woesebacteria bacterium]HRT40059.1 glycosyltransferase [Candidatus Woesebacteria bacterium]